MTTETRLTSTRSSATYRPLADIIELDDRFELLADVPGAQADSMDVRFEQGVLSVHAPVAGRADLEHQEFGVGDWKVRFEFGDAVDAAGIEAAVRDGVLTVSLPKAQATLRRKVDVRSV